MKTKTLSPEDKRIKSRYQQKTGALLNNSFSQTKFSKSLKNNWVIAGLSLEPDNTLCPYASKDGDPFVIFHDGFNNIINDIDDPFSKKSCMDLCISNTGQMKFKDSVNLRNSRTSQFYDWKHSRDPFNGFVLKLQSEIEELKTKCLEDGFKLAIRLNTVSDVLWERMPYLNAPNIFEYNNDIIFYDYSKVPIDKRINRIPGNYHLTFSHSGHFDRSENALKNNINIAIVFYCLRENCPNCKSYAGNKYSCKPSIYEMNNKIYKVLDGDINDLRFLDDGPAIIGLSYKTASKRFTNTKNISGFGYQRILPNPETWINPKIKKGS